MTKTKVMLALFLVGALFSGCAFITSLLSAIGAAAWNDTEEGKVAKEYTPENEYYIGRGVSAAIIDKYPATDNSKPTTQNQVAYLNQMAGYIEAASVEIDKHKLGNHVSRDDENNERLDRFALYKGVHVGILETQEVMAYSTPGGFIWISRGTIAMCQNEDEVAAVIAHEIGHTVMNHGMESYRKATEGRIVDNPMFKKITSPLGKVVGNFMQLVGGFADNLVQNGYGKDQEYEADNFGMRALGTAGYNPRAILAMFSRLQDYEKAHPSDEGMFSKNHPDTDDRIAELEKALKDPKAGIKMPTDDPGRAAREKRFKEVWGR